MKFTPEYIKWCRDNRDKVSELFEWDHGQWCMRTETNECGTITGCLINMDNEREGGELDRMDKEVT